MKTAKLGTLFLVAILSLGGIGVSYAAWTEYVDIDVYATTGNLDFKIEDMYVIDADGATITLTKNNDYYWTVVISNTYPGWKGYINILHRNAGTVNLKYQSFQVLNLAGADALKNGYTVKFYTPADLVNIFGTLYEFTDMQYYEGNGIDHWGIPPEAITLTPGQGQWSKVSLELDSGITGYEGSTVSFTFRMWATQA